MVNLNQKLKRVELKSFEIENEIIFKYFDSIPSKDRENKLFKALYIGVLALMEDRLSAFLAKTSNELGTELESLKMIFDMNKELFYKSSVKGNLAEEEVAQFLNDYFASRKLGDQAFLTGNTIGNLPRNKTGDIICEIEGAKDLRIVIECKFDKSIAMGDIASKDVFSRRNDTVWSQLIESQANRNSEVAIIVLDRALVSNSILNEIENVGYIPSIGFVAIIDSQRGDYTNLSIAYMLCRDIAINSEKTSLNKDILGMIVSRIIKDINEVRTIKSLVQANIDNNKNILKQLEKSMQLMEFNQEYLREFLKTGNISKESLLKFYYADDVKDKFNLIEKEINDNF
ncbi:hypothetical protein JCM19294_968 [Nonlabens tegetincola]|uniref:Uncharacterized protein n=1 Tax=Nonlabens tegetincola TaxID=323273 RepID=A0A090Q0Q3_9FLAO|nr:hypothetical protein [Nonlabens tegetincola]GAK96659.1 hypothetical protein JCM19294_968 [Nonlabens tegetincola]